MWVFAIALMVQAASSWTVQDTTDNNTGKRDVLAVQSSQNADAPGSEAGLWLGCNEGKTRLSLRWPQRIGTGFVTIAVERLAPRSAYTIMPATAWKISNSGDGRFAEIEGEPLRKLVADAQGATSLTFVVYQQAEEIGVLFDADGFSEAYRRVFENCSAAKALK